MKKTALILSLIIALCMSAMAQSDQMPQVNGNLTAHNISLLSTGNSFTKTRFDDPITKDYDFYIQKSKNQRTAGWVLLGAGVLLSGVGLLVAQNSNLDHIEGGVIIMGLGALSGIISIPLMIMAHANKNKAKLMLSKQKTGFGVPSNVSKDITGITLSFSIGK